MAGMAGSTISTLLHDKINPKDCQVLSLGDSGFLQFFKVVSSDYGKPRICLLFVGHFRLIGWLPLSDKESQGPTNSPFLYVTKTWSQNFEVVNSLGTSWVIALFPEQPHLS